MLFIDVIVQVDPAGKHFIELLADLWCNLVFPNLRPKRNYLLGEGLILEALWHLLLED